ncbi:MAG: tRNA (adenosine(37)-N6)-dimethylallyltransferase MiaA [Sphingomonas sp.]|uniref:tRNA (adenosine(37)-N6)-dimethylallyltransferase MiaA n=1 Tax=Sphingomonas sp. TaxID=28214 RepID=UPI0025E37466|nr:tRNA (adenosine(37)-N6)-dimethylallyltransferase MiaA [Sphingomonas sp.]MBY0283863.1 tRNA (adenosine(37)-N6)-dimethylallyltransferase MiaA [Sphingomonas sp.]
MDGPSRPKLALIAGPTASGKSALAIDLAERANGVVINADSAQVYADLRVLSARPTPEDEARVPHRLFGHVDAAQDYSAAAWATDAKIAIDAAIAEAKLPILVGGTGLYLRTLLDGIAPVPDIDPQIRAEVRALPVAAAHAHLAVLDPDAAARLNAADTTRVARALEVVRSTGRTLAVWQAERAGGIADKVTLAPLILLPERDWLMARCDARLEAMFDGGAEADVRALLDRCDVADSAPVRRAIGVREIGGWLAGVWSRDEALDRARLATRQYAKRQYTWFRNQPPEDWPRRGVGNVGALLALLEIEADDVGCTQ